MPVQYNTDALDGKGDDYVEGTMAQACTVFVTFELCVHSAAFIHSSLRFVGKLGSIIRASASC